MAKRLLIVLIVVIAAGLLVYSLWFKKNEALISLPYYGEHKVDSTLIDGVYKTDTTYHRVSDFSFIDQTGKAISQKDMDGSVYVVDYFFTTCHSICPVMSSQMKRVYDVYKGDLRVKFLSHTVDPETDSVNVLAEYARRHDADTKQWHFVTGDKKALYDQARKSYYLDAQEGDGGEDDFIHTPNFALIDKNKYIRGYYNGVDSADVDKLIKDIRILIGATK